MPGNEESSALPSDAVSRDSLKRLTGQFELESIFQLALASRGLNALGCLPECLGLEFLDLSDNQLTDAGMLSGLKRLRYLNLAGNRLSGTAGLDGCESLVELNLAGNLIACTEDLQPLGALDNLVSLHLQDRSRGLANPICMSAGYAAKILSCLPGLTALDGDRIRGSGEDYYQLCQQVDQALSDGPEGSSAAASSRPVASGLGEAFWKLSGGPQSSAVTAAAVAAEEAFADAVARVRDRELRAMLLMEESERDLKKKLKV